MELLGFRLGLGPREIEALTFAELRAMWDGWVWRHRRRLDALATHASWVRGAWVNEPGVDEIRSSFGWHEPREVGEED